MKRAALVGAGTLAGVAAILALNPEARTTASAATSPTTSSSGTDAGSSNSSSSSSSGSTSGGASSSGSSSPGTSTSGSTSTGTSTAAGTDGTYTGDTVDVGHGYGTIQLQVTVSGGKVTDITALAVPQNDPRSSQISSYAVPQLVSQAIAAQSSSISGISGATFTSNGFAQSLTSALTQAGLS
ncbi:MAG TPA: FMN-binding protein [Candidatus Nanopelagicales bacterium]|nr:FMN-binding protein [Candidatus Nanopelagicales bacterium]